MRLTTLDIKGFKSFPDKTSIHFNDNITGVVGPNGSGKSNIVDAIRWVLGEQRTSNLRSEKMDNLIFNGSKARKASGLAQVSLTFENTKGIIASEFKDITVTRILHRTGESEYRINDVACRLKDITNLFLDTGVASDSYAIIELRMIDEILNDRENSRRRLFEQAAGVSKYKKRKKETLNKLSATDADLARVEDLLFEISGNLKQLESQARKAKKYQTLKEQYKELSIELAKMSLAQYQGSYQSIETQKREQEDKKLAVQTKIDQIDAALEKQKAGLLEKEKSLTSRQKELNELINNINKKESDKKVSSEQLRFLREKVENLRQQVSSSSLQIKTLTDQYENLKTRKSEQEKTVNELTAKVEEEKKNAAEVRTENDRLKKALDEAQIKKQEIERKSHDLEKSVAINATQKENLLRTLEQNSTKNEELDSHLSELNKSLHELEKQKDSGEKELSKLQDQEKKVNNDIESTTLKLQEAQQQLASQNRTLDAKRNEYNLNKSLVDNLEGFPESIKFLKKNSRKSTEFQLLSDIIYCNESYRVAIENFLEPFLNYFIVKNLDEAKESVNLLSNGSIGRANFFILEEFKSYKPGTTKKIPNTTAALEVTEIDEKYQKLAAFLLEDVYIINEDKFTQEDVYESIEMKDQHVTLLASNGKYVRTQYSLSGGAIGLFEGMKLGRQKNLEKLKTEIEKLEKQIKGVEKKVIDYQKSIQELKWQSKQETITSTRETLAGINNQIISVQTKMENYKSFASENATTNADIQAKVKKLAADNQENENQLETLNKQKEEINSSHAKLATDYNEVNQKLSAATERFNEINIRFHQQQNLLNSIDQEAKYNNNQIEDLNNRINQSNSDIQNSAATIQEQEKKIKELEAELIKAYEEKDAFDKTLSDQEAIYYKARGDINELEEQLKTQNKNISHIDVMLNEIKDRSTELKIELSGLKERLSVEFHIDINDIIDESPSEGLVEEDLREKVQKIKSRIENFGEINPMAVEAYEEMKQRYDFIIAQKEDLLEARKSLMQTIEEIETTAKEKFLEAFEKARENFIMIFQSLFSEDDSCDMILTTPDNPLEAEIDIIAKPKGKKPQGINQLSGGEKSLTALAILFALYLLKPAPFCILDEVDAPLDDTNIGKFNSAIKDFSKESQFILVTHNKQTMASVDVIYGVTMPENGVSRVVPVDFRNLN